MGAFFLILVLIIDLIPALFLLIILNSTPFSAIFSARSFADLFLSVALTLPLTLFLSAALFLFTVLLLPPPLFLPVFLRLLKFILLLSDLLSVLSFILLIIN